MAFSINGFQPKPISYPVTVLAETRDYDIVASDGGTYIQYTGGSPTVFTVPTNASAGFADDVEILIEQSNTGQIEFVGANGVVITSKAELRTSKQGAVVKLKKLATDSWILYGDVLDNTDMAMMIAMS